MESEGSQSGIIRNNSAEAEGGGIYVQQAGKAYITAGTITENRSNGGMFGGGGIYVNGGKDPSVPNGRLELKNVKVSDNQVDSSLTAGGGIAGCPSAVVKIYLDDGGLIYGNNTGKGKGDIHINNSIAGWITPNVPSVPGQNADGNGTDGLKKQEIYVSRYMYGGGLYKWTVAGTEDQRVNYDKLTGVPKYSVLDIYSAADGKDLTVTDEELSVFITNNTAATNGGGIGTNGDVIIGTADPTPEVVDVQVRKVWVDEEGAEYTPDELESEISNYLESVEFELWGRIKRDSAGEEEGWELIESGFSKWNSVTKEWSKYTFRNLTKQNEKGEEWEYRVKEKQGDTYIGSASEEVSDNSNVILWKLENRPTYSLKLMKTVAGEAPENAVFGFTITLKDRHGNPYNAKELNAVLKKANQEEQEITVVTNADGQIQQQLGDGEYMKINGLSSGTKYTVTEEENKDFDVAATITSGKVGSESIKNSLGNAIEETTVVLGVNTVEFINKTKEPSGSLSISKTVAGIGNREKEWNFAVELFTEGEDGTKIPLVAEVGKVFRFTYTKKNTNGVLATGTVELDGINARFIAKGAESGQDTVLLADGQTVTIDGLPLGTLYEVKEIEANTEGYQTTAENESGTIANNREEVLVKYTNTLPDNPPDTPHNPPGGGGGGGGSTPPRPTTTIDIPEVPLADFPNEPVTELIEEMEVPLVALPKTGDARHAGLLLTLFGIAGLGALFSAASLKKNKEED